MRRYAAAAGGRQSLERRICKVRSLLFGRRCRCPDSAVVSAVSSSLPFLQQARIPAKVITACKISPAQAPFDWLWEDEFIAALGELWGPQVYVHLLTVDHPVILARTRHALQQAFEEGASLGSVRDAGLEHSRLALLIPLTEGDPLAEAFLDQLPSQETLPYLYPLLAPGDRFIDRQGLVEALANAGPQASGAIPYLIHILREENASWELRHAASDALTQITGENMDTTNPQEWQEWWDARSDKECQYVLRME